MRHRWKRTFHNQHLPQSYSMRQVYTENIDCCPPYRSATKKHGSIPLEMVFPDILSWVEQTNNFPCLGIHTSNVWSFVVVAGKTGERQVDEFVSPMMFTRNNVIDLKSQQIILLRHLTILAGETRSLPHLLNERLLHLSLGTRRIRFER